MNRNKIEISTAKAAMQRMVECMNAKTPSLMEVFSTEQLDSHESLLFFKMVMRFLHKNRMQVFAFAETETELLKLKEYLEEKYPQIEIAENATMEEAGISDDMILNRVNGTETEFILSVLSGPVQEEFMERNKVLLNARVWFGFGELFRKMKKEQSFIGQLKKVFFRQTAKKEEMH